MRQSRTHFPLTDGGIVIGVFLTAACMCGLISCCRSEPIRTAPRVASATLASPQQATQIITEAKPATRPNDQSSATSDHFTYRGGKLTPITRDVFDESADWLHWSESTCGKGYLYLRQLKLPMHQRRAHGEYQMTNIWMEDFRQIFSRDPRPYDREGARADVIAWLRHQQKELRIDADKEVLCYLYQHKRATFWKWYCRRSGKDTR